MEIETYFEELEKKYQETKFRYDVSLGNRYSFLLTIYKKVKAEENIVFKGNMIETDEINKYFVYLPKLDMKLIVDFFM